MQLGNVMNNKTPRELLNQFYIDNHLGADGGNASSSVKIEMNRYFYFYIPNFDARRKAVIKHDIHHLLTGYTTELKGESEISAWEIASGCKKYRAAFFINLSGFMISFWINFRGALKAFSRGRKTKNLYYDEFSTEEALDMTIDELRVLMRLDQYPKEVKPSFTDVLLFLAFTLFGGLYSLLLMVLLPFIILYSITITLGQRKQKV